MFTNKKNLFLLVLIITLCFFVEPIYAGPGGYVAKALFKSFWGKLLLIVLAIIFLPLIIYIRCIELLKIRKNKKILQKLSLKKKEFNWLQLEKEFSNCIRRVYIAWDKEDMSEVKDYVNHWYWQNQQLVFLEEWKRQNVKNVSRLKVLSKINPLYLEITDADNFEGTRIALSVDVDAEDYLMERDTKVIVQGKKGYQNLDYVWIFEYNEGKWLLDEIKEGALTLQFAKLDNVIPEGLNTVLA